MRLLVPRGMTEGKHLLCYELSKLLGVVPQALVYETGNQRIDLALDAAKPITYHHRRQKVLFEISLMCSEEIWHAYLFQNLPEDEHSPTIN